MNRRYILDGQDLGTYPLPANYLAEHSVFWYCIRCRTIYATLEVEGGEAWDARAGCCPRCRPFPSAFWQVPGSIWEDFDRQRNWALPDPIVEREFWLHINFNWENIYGKICTNENALY